MGSAYREYPERTKLPMTTNKSEPLSDEEQQARYDEAIGCLKETAIELHDAEATIRARDETIRIMALVAHSRDERIRELKSAIGGDNWVDLRPGEEE